mmetsp:Transcript_71599/g.138319  ORF Transcript_71599/g.138319 Transcript_71599/m.138319 type:complete len:1099 (+) Transcript_71599:93-3389(+)
MAIARPLGTFGPVRAPIFAPSGGCVAQFTAEDRPVDSPTLAYVHGFHAAARPPAVFLGESIVAFAAGRLIVGLDLSSGSQRFAYGHTDAITCLASSVEQGLGASGQIKGPRAKFAEVLVWRTDTMQVCGTLIFHQADIEAVGFTHGGEVLVTIASDRDHTMALWAVAREGRFRLRKSEGAPIAVCSAYKSGSVTGFLPAPHFAAPSDGRPAAAHFATFGAGHVKFWRSERLNPAALEGRRGAFGADGPPKAVCAAAWATGGRFVAGGNNGEVYFFEGTQAIRCIQNQRFPVALLLPLRDALLAVYSHGLCSMLQGDRIIDVDISSLAGAPETKMQSAIVGGASWHLSRLVLASRTHLMLLDLAGNAERIQSCLLLLAQPSRALTAACSHPNESRVYTGSLDGGVRCYRTDVQRCAPGKSFRAPGAVTCLAVSGCAPGASTSWLAVGCEDSTLSIVGEDQFQYIFRRCLSENKSRLTCARFSACDVSGVHPLWLAVGAEDGFIYTFRFKEPNSSSTRHTGPEMVVKVATLRGHVAPICDLSFADTLPAGLLLSVDASGQPLAFDVPLARRLPSLAASRDVCFMPWTAPVGWPVQGCWTPARVVEPPKLPPRRFCEVLSHSTIAVSDAFDPAVELFPFPCPTAPTRAPARLEGPASLVVALTHSKCSDCLLAASDTALFVWQWHHRTRLQPAEGSPWRVADAVGDAAGGVLLETPEGRRHHAMALGQQLTPQPKTPKQRRSPSMPSCSRSPGRAVGESLLQTPPPARRPSAKRQLSWSPLSKVAWEEEEEDEAALAPSRAEFWAGTNEGSVQMTEERKSAVHEVASLPLFGEQAESEEVVVSIDTGNAPLECTSEANSPPSYASASIPAGHHKLEVAPPAVPRSTKIGAAWAAHLPPGHSRWDADEAAGLRNRCIVTPKIGTTETVAKNTQTIHAETEFRARTIHERQRFDTVGMLMGGRGRQNAAIVVAPAGSCSEVAAGKFLVRCRDVGERYEVEVRLPGGQLSRILRNPLRRTLTFEGEAPSCWARGGAAGGRRPTASELMEERLIVRLPPNFDLTEPPAQVDRGFAEGRCFVAVHQGAGQHAWVENNLSDDATGGV